MDISIVIPAYNEEGRIGGVLAPLMDLDLIKEIIVINDGSVDETSREARRYPVTVIDFQKNYGKAAAMKRGIIESTGEWILFLDADLCGLKKEHIVTMIEYTLKKDVDMVLGLFTKGRLITDISHKIAPFLSGQRLVKRIVLEQIPIWEDNRYGVELVITEHINKIKGKVKKVYMPHVYHVPKEVKRGWIKGKIEKHIMYRNILFTFFELYLLPRWIRRLYRYSS
ncbi:MAG: glycosyltransferase family 2 protein [Epulopiscium sp.]|nr:glycosyltransferase family 2 protein [Candidatus Epulonipiscium sp.]